MLRVGRALTGQEITGLLILNDASPRIYFERNGRKFEGVLMLMTETEIADG